MERRDFVKQVGVGATMATVDWTRAVDAIALAPVIDLERGFARPPADARPHTWWHWMNGNVTADGITRDLEAMARVGVGGVQMFDVGTGIPKGPVATLSPEWVRLVEHAASEANRLGLSFTMHNCPGWSSSGGPWITPERAMQQLVWSEANVDGGRQVEVALPKPFAKIGYYRDAFVLAFPSLPGEGRASVARTTVTTAPDAPGANPQPATPVPAGTNVAQVRVVASGTETTALADWDLSAGVDLRSAGPDKPAYITYEFTEPFEARSVIVHSANIPGAPGGGPPQPPVLEVSDDGVSFRPVMEFVALAGGATGGNAAGPNVPLTASFAAVRGRFFRFGTRQSRRVTEFQLSPVARIANWPAKTNLARLRNQEQSPATDLGPAIDPRSVVDVTRYLRADGTLAWNAPAGRWTILRIGHTPTARMQNAPSDTGQGLEVDKFDAAAVQFHFDAYFGKLYESLKPLAAKKLLGALVDSYEVGMQNWTPSFPAEFRKRRGYDLVRYMPAMTGRVVGDSETTERFLWDVRRAQADLIADNYYAKFATLCKQHGMKSHTEPYGPNNGPFDELQVGALVDEPMGEFWLRQAGAQWGWSLKLASSIAHVWDKPVVGAESFTGRAQYSKWQEHPYATKAIGDLMYTYGLTRYIFHRFAHQPHPDAVPGMTMGPWGSHFDRTNTWFEHAGPWLQYVARAQYMLRQGLFVG
ncbi:MAG: glycosyl hydrolase, partial [Gemmatimonadaceae bacterium]